MAGNGWGSMSFRCAVSMLVGALALALTGGGPRPHHSVDLEVFLNRGPGVYRDLFPGVSLRVSPHPLGLEYDWIVAPGAGPGAISMTFRDASLSIGPGGHLLVRRQSRVVPHTKPHAYQTVRGQRVPVEARFTLLSGTTAGFQLGPYNPAYELVVDPVVLFSWSLSGSWTTWPTGGLFSDEITAIAADARGFTYVTGTARSADFPTTEGAFQRELRGESDLYIAKIDPEGKLVYSTRLGGSGGDFGNSYALDAPNGAMAVDTEGNVYLYAWTTSSDFPGLKPGASGPGVITKFRADGKGVAFTIGFVGVVRGMAFDPSGNLWYGGWGRGLGPTPGALQTIPGGGYVEKISPTGDLLYSTYVGRDPRDVVEAIAVDAQGNVYAVGWTFSPDFPTTPSAFQRKFPIETCEGPYASRCNAGFVTKINSSGTALAYSTFLGGSHSSFALGVTVDARGKAYVTGATYAPDFPVTPDAYQSERGRSYAVFLSRLDPTGSRVEYSTYLGGFTRTLDYSGESDQGRFLTLSGDTLYLTGTASNLTFPEVNPIRQVAPNRCGISACTETFLTVFRTTDMQPVFSTYIGSTWNDQVRGMAVDGAGNVVVASECQSYFGAPVRTPAYAPAFPLPGSKLQHNFITKVALGGPPVPLIGSLHDAANLRYSISSGIIGGQIATLFGSNITARQGIVSAPSLPLPLSLDGVSVEIGGMPAPLYALARTGGVEQINFLFPWDADSTVPNLTGNKIVHVVVKNNGSRSLPDFAAFRTAPGLLANPNLFVGNDGTAIAVHAADGSLVSPANPARRGEVILLFASGLGSVDPPVKTGDPAPASPLSWVTLRPGLTFAGVVGEVLFCGLAPGFAGLYQINVRIPALVPTGRIQIGFTYEGNIVPLPGAPIDISE